MSRLTASPNSETFTLETKLNVLPVPSESPEQLSFLTSGKGTSDRHHSTSPRGVQRHSTAPNISCKADPNRSPRDRRTQTGLDSQKTHGSRWQKSRVSSIRRRLLEGRHGNPESFQPVQGCSRKSTMDTEHSVPFEQTRPWDQKAILSLDGGGIRGYSALLIIRELMKKIQQIEESWPQGNSPSDGPAYSSYHPVDPVQAMSTDSASDNQLAEDTILSKTSSLFLPCHYFDYMAGTSTGGLISIMLGRLRMKVEDCIKEYETLGGKVFGKCRWFHIRSVPPLWLPREKYNHETLEAVIQSLIDRRIPKIGHFPGGKTFAFDENRCRVVVVAYQENPGSGTEKTYLFRTYKNLKKAPVELERNPGPAHDIPILEVARATSAAPGYFKEVTIGGLKYLDGGFGANNPCVEIFREVRNLNNYDEKCMSCVMSIGTGKNDEKRIQSNTGLREVLKTGLGKFIHYENFARKWASDSEAPHTNMMGEWEASDQSFKYFRLNVDKGLACMQLDEWNCRGATRIALGRCIGWVKFRNFQRKASESEKNIYEEKSRKMANDIDNHSDQSSSTYLTHQAAQAPDKTGLDQHIPSFFKPHNKTLATICTQTQSYLARPDCQRWLQECAQYLVENRRARVKADPERWQKTCFGTWYQCQVRGCQRGQREYPDARAMEKHLLDKHREMFSKGDEEGRRRLERTVRSDKVTVH